ncbi:integrase [Rhodoferax koreense]|uniref:Integrase n=1 Tax=Rhodoferax koreensis TaxID=1842727 RepID=A0A1P8JTQ7_9BURK|nr:site-specific integrase [Rhodoferax koreense]APW37118.1 integrase [Rhodoferax koreense]
MGGGQPAGNIACPRGIKIREFKHELRIQIAFSFRSVECRELLPPGPITKTAVTLANGLRAEILRKISEGTFVYGDYFPSSPRAKTFGADGVRITVGKRLQKQLEAYEHQVANGTMSPSTLDGYRKAIRSERMAHWTDKPLAAVTPSELRTWVASLDVTAKFARNLLTPLRSVFEDALNDDLIEFNPFDRIALTKLLKQTTKASDYEVDPFTEDEREALISACRPDEAPMVRFWFATGLRPGELMALQWPKIDWTEKKARIDRNQVAGVVKGPKTEAGIRDIELSTEAIAALTAQKPITFLANAHVWVNPASGKAWTTDAQLRKTLWVSLCKRAAVRYRNPYQVRHTWASSQITAGVNPWFVADQLGHVDVQLVFTTYGKFMPADYRKPRVAGLKVVANNG